MHAYVLQHVPFEGPESIAPWLKAAGYQVKPVHLYIGDQLPVPAAVNFLAVMGGPMSVNDEDRHHWLTREKAFIRKVIDLNRPVLGICLGAQLMAAALGARIYPNKIKEIGWFPVEGMAHGNPVHFTFPASFEAFHWHGETFDLPEGATHLARSGHCENQAFQYGPRVMALQFHLETTRHGAEALVQHCGGELNPGRTIQSAEDILAATAARYAATNRLMDRVLAHLHHTVA